jgi:hypothetical protein
VELDGRDLRLSQGRLTWGRHQARRPGTRAPSAKQSTKAVRLSETRNKGANSQPYGVLPVSSRRSLHNVLCRFLPRWSFRYQRGWTWTAAVRRESSRMSQHASPMSQASMVCNNVHHVACRRAEVLVERVVLNHTQATTRPSLPTKPKALPSTQTVSGNLSNDRCSGLPSRTVKQLMQRLPGHVST